MIDLKRGGEERAPARAQRGRISLHDEVWTTKGMATFLGASPGRQGLRCEPRETELPDGRRMRWMAVWDVEEGR